MSINFSISVDQGWWMKLGKINDVLATHDSISKKTRLRFEIWVFFVISGCKHDTPIEKFYLLKGSFDVTFFH